MVSETLQVGEPRAGLWVALVFISGVGLGVIVDGSVEGARRANHGTASASSGRGGDAQALQPWMVGHPSSA